MEKSKVFDCDEPPNLRGWGEAKPVSYWTTLLDCLDVGQVMDLSPGSGGLAEAALASEIGLESAGTKSTTAGWSTFLTSSV